MSTRRGQTINTFLAVSLKYDNVRRTGLMMKMSKMGEYIPSDYHHGSQTVQPDCD